MTELRRSRRSQKEKVSSGEKVAARKTALRQIAQLREENVGRRRLRCRRPNSGDAAVVGDNRLFGPLPPAKEITILLTENSPILFNRHSSGLF